MSAWSNPVSGRKKTPTIRVRATAGRSSSAAWSVSLGGWTDHESKISCLLDYCRTRSDCDRKRGRWRRYPRRKERKDMSSRERATGKPGSRLTDQRIRDLGGWRGETLARMRAVIREADLEMIEEWKWRGTPVWSRHGIVCTGEAYTKVVKLTFARGAKIPDPSHLFNSSLEGNTRRAIDIHDGEKVNAGAFRALVKAAVAQNGTPAKKR